MTSDLRSTMDAELDAIAPPSPLNGVAIATLGRRRLHRRRVAGALSGLAATVALAVVAVQMLGAATVPVASGLASLPPKDTYWWYYGEPQTTDYSSALTAALQRELGALPDATFGLNADEGDLRASEIPPIQRFDAQLADDSSDDERVGPVVPLYRLPEATLLYVMTPGTDAVAMVVRVLPSGSYLRESPFEATDEGPPMPVDPYVEPYCADWSNSDPDPALSISVDHDCVRSTLDTGETMLVDSARTSSETTDPLWMNETVVLYTLTGTAVVLNASSTGGEENPAVDLDRLVAIAKALAAVPVP